MWYILIHIEKKEKHRVFYEDVSSNFEVTGANNSEFSYSQLFLLTTLLGDFKQSLLQIILSNLQGLEMVERFISL